jgi:molecular chaperone GrpE
MSDDTTNPETSEPGGATTEGRVETPGSGDDAPDPAEPPRLDEDLDAVRAERDQWRDVAVRLQADFENYRKRAAGQAADEADRAAGRIVEQLLPVLDACEAALAHGVTGVDAVWTPLLDALQKQGLERLDVAGRPYDPSVAEAVVHEPGDGGEDGGPVVAEVLRTGWRWKGRVLRAAMVRVKG